jgi:hypothetical protein
MTTHQKLFSGYQGGISTGSILTRNDLEEVADTLRRLTASWGDEIQLEVSLVDRHFLAVSLEGPLSGDQYAAVHNEVGREANRIEAEMESRRLI